MDLGEAHSQLSMLRNTLNQLIKRDPEQEVGGMAIPVLDAVLKEVRGVLPDHAVVSQIRDVISPENVEGGEPVRAADLIHVVNALYAAILEPWSEWERAHRRYVR